MFASLYHATCPAGCAWFFSGSGKSWKSLFSKMQSFGALDCQHPGTWGLASGTLTKRCLWSSLALPRLETPCEKIHVRRTTNLREFRPCRSKHLCGRHPFTDCWLTFIVFPNELTSFAVTESLKKAIFMHRCDFPRNFFA